MTASSSIILEAKGLTRAYSKDHHSLVVLEDVGFSVARGSTCAIVGPSGSGKTTLLGLCAGLDLPTSGSVCLNGQDLTKLNEDQRARLRNECVGFVFQNFQLIPTLTALENVMVPLELRGGSRRTEGREQKTEAESRRAEVRPAREEAMDLLDRVGLGGRLGHFPTQLSGGEQQRVALARAFINRPQILFADEPTGNLDDATSHKIIDILFELNRSLATALVLVTHNHELAEKTERVIRLRGGRMIT